jgi:hypothetical protein
MTENAVQVFRPKARSQIKPALVAGVGTTSWMIGNLLALPQEAGVPWIRMAVVTVAGLGLFSLLFLGARAFLTSRQSVSIMPSGLRGPDAAGHQAFCGWDNIADVQVVEGAQDRYLLIKGRYLATPLKVPLAVFEQSGATELVERYAGDKHCLNDALRRAGA